MLHVGLSEEEKKSQRLGLVPLLDYWIRFIWCLLNQRNKHPLSQVWDFHVHVLSSGPSPLSQDDIVRRAVPRWASGGMQCPAPSVTVAKHSPSSPDVPAEHTSHLFTWPFTDAYGKGDRCEGLASSPNNNSDDLRGIFILYIYSDVWKWTSEKSIKITQTVGELRGNQFLLPGVEL